MKNFSQTIDGTRQQMEEYSAETRRQIVLQRVESAIGEINLAISLVKGSAIEADLTQIGLVLLSVQNQLTSTESNKVTLIHMKVMEKCFLDVWNTLSRGLVNMYQQMEEVIDQRTKDADSVTVKIWVHALGDIHRLLGEFLQSTKEEKRKNLQVKFMAFAAKIIPDTASAEHEEVQVETITLSVGQENVTVWRQGPARSVWVQLQGSGSTVLDSQGEILPPFLDLCAHCNLNEEDQSLLIDLAAEVLKRSMDRVYA